MNRRELLSTISSADGNYNTQSLLFQSFIIIIFIFAHILLFVYLSLHSPSVMGNLWDVTDGDMDKFTTALFHIWLDKQPIHLAIPTTTTTTKRNNNNNNKKDNQNDHINTNCLLSS